MELFETLNLKPMSKAVLNFIADKPPMKAAEIGEALNLKTRQVDACVTKSLVPFGLAIRQAHLSEVFKKDYNLIVITEYGKKYLNWVNKSY